MSVNEAHLRQNLLRLASQEPRGSKLQKAIAHLLFASDFDPKEIGGVEEGALEHDPGDEAAQENFTQQEFSELRTKTEEGTLEDGEVADLPEGQQAKQARLSKLSSSERALFKDLVKLAHTDKKARGPILSMLREAGLVTASRGPDSKGRKARFPEGPEGTRLFEEWLASQPQSVQDDWEANKEKYGDKFKN